MGKKGKNRCDGVVQCARVGHERSGTKARTQAQAQAQASQHAKVHQQHKVRVKVKKKRRVLSYLLNNS